MNGIVGHHAAFVQDYDAGGDALHDLQIVGTEKHYLTA